MVINHAAGPNHGFGRRTASAAARQHVRRLLLLHPPGLGELVLGGGVNHADVADDAVYRAVVASPGNAQTLVPADYIARVFIRGRHLKGQRLRDQLGLLPRLELLLHQGLRRLMRALERIHVFDVALGKHHVVMLLQEAPVWLRVTDVLVVVVMRMGARRVGGGGKLVELRLVILLLSAVVVSAYLPVLECPAWARVLLGLESLTQLLRRVGAVSEVYLRKVRGVRGDVRRDLGVVGIHEGRLRALLVGVELVVVYLVAPHRLLLLDLICLLEVVAQISSSC